jgi:hypothetical protein
VPKAALREDLGGSTIRTTWAVITTGACPVLEGARMPKVSPASTASLSWELFFVDPGGLLGAVRRASVLVGVVGVSDDFPNRQIAALHVSLLAVQELLQSLQALYNVSGCLVGLIKLQDGTALVFRAPRATSRDQAVFLQVTWHNVQ